MARKSSKKSTDICDHIVEIPRDGIPWYDSYRYARMSHHVVNNVRIMRWVRGDDRHEVRT